MAEEKEAETTPFDAELEIIKLQGRFRWIVNELEELKQKDRSLSARISRMGLKRLEEEEEEEEEPRGIEETESLEERAIRISELLDKVERAQ